MNNIYQKISLKSTRIADSFKYYTYELFKKEDFFKSLETYCMFIGYPRSGHSLLGSLLDAHPEIILAHESNALRLFERGFNARKIYYLLLQNSHRHVKTGRRDIKYSYQVPHQWQGKFKTLKVIGDKKGSGSNRVISDNPEILNILRDRVNIPVKFIHVTRNPYDNITTMMFKNKKGLEYSIDSYFKKCESVNNLKQKVDPKNIFDLKHETLIYQPKDILKQLCTFLNVEATQDYLDDCASIIFKSPNQTRFNFEWTKESIDLVQSKIERFDFLQGYSYEK
ncbi:MAG: sulfotransferase [Xenococcaceae cyanobacterium MO_188.B32]|nr:sulfotransferase [Xenococcaceae cyanobacterium MO_188.B32]